MLTSDLLHQVIKGTFKDHLVEWVYNYLVITHGETAANVIMDDIDCRLASTPAFPGLRRFPHGRCFKQWTGDDSKALMKIFLAAVASYLPDEMMQCLRAFLDFCYLVRRQDIDEQTLSSIDSDINSADRSFPRYLDEISEFIGFGNLEYLTRRFLYEHLHNALATDTDIEDLPHITSKVNVFNSAVAEFHAPSDVSGIRGM
ncbi:hypothetical protein VKT23_000082 [Stygiomarasmius scandens]|uniref:Uncharacterized protein n=1 Tax=Marasmiellus scandens TaxID=2682957 RepID=A0ABR1K3H7_9AGAR